SGLASRDAAGDRACGRPRSPRDARESLRLALEPAGSRRRLAEREVCRAQDRPDADAVRAPRAPRRARGRGAEASPERRARALVRSPARERRGLPRARGAGADRVPDLRDGVRRSLPRARGERGGPSARRPDVRVPDRATARRRKWLRVDEARLWGLLL